MSDDNVVSFPAKPVEVKVEAPDLVWRCACGCYTFSLHSDGRMLCATCMRPTASHGSDWRRELPDVPADAEILGEGSFRMKSFTSTSLVDGHEMWLRRAKKEIDKTKMLIAILEDGVLRTHGVTAETTEEIEFYRRRFRDLEDMICNAKPGGKTEKP